MSVNPFLSVDRQNFPEFSPMFKGKTPSSTEKSSSFRWSIDQIARLKPADIDIDPATLATTNGHSPAVDSEAEKASENFFAQKMILPSPWTGPVSSSKLVPAQLPPKRVTFSPLPPATAFIREESLVESEIRDSKTTDAGTQTLMTFPVNFDLYQLLGPGFNDLEEKSSAACDLGNSSLRRKLFGQPDRQGSISLSSSLSSEGDDEAHPAVEHFSPKATPFTPLRDRIKTPVSKKPLRHPSSSSTPSNPLFSSAIVYDDITESDPAHSSMVLGLHGNGLPADISPIGCITSDVLYVEGEGVNIDGEGGNLSEETKEKGSGTNGEVQLVDKVLCQQKFPSTPSKDVHMQSLPCLSPICGMGISPMPVHMLHQQSPFHHHHGNASTPAHIVAAARVKVPRTTASGKAACTSTPNTAALKRQLVASPFASPVLKQPCTKRLDVVEEDSAHSPPPCRQLHPHSPNHRDILSEESDSESSIPQPLSLADLQTETYDLTSITPTACTTDFAQFELDDPTENDITAGNTKPHPLHSTAAGHMMMMSSSSTHWNPPIHSTMVDSQYKIQGSSCSAHHLTNRPIPQVSLPLVGGLSRIQSHSHSVANGTSSESQSHSGIVADSGVATSGEFNFNATAALHGSTRGGESGIVMSGSDPALKTANSEGRTHHMHGGGQAVMVGGAKVGENSTGDDLASKLHSREDGNNYLRNGLILMANRETKKEDVRRVDGKTGEWGSGDKSRRAVAHCHSEVDSGLVFSPEHNLEHISGEQPALQQFIPTSERVKFYPPSPSVMANGVSSEQPKFYIHHQKTPSRHSNLTSIPPSMQGFVVPMSPANLHHHHHHAVGGGGGAPGLINNGLGSHYPAFSSRLTSKCSTGLSSAAVLPSRLKLSSTNASLKSPSYMYSSFVPHHGDYRGRENHAPLSSCSQDVFSVVGGASKTTPTSRYSGKGTLKSLANKSNLSGQMDDIIRKKEVLKARLQFTSPVDSPSRRGISTTGSTGSGSSSLLRSPVSTRTAAHHHVGRPRIPLYEASLNRPRSPLTRWNNEGFTPFSPSPLPSQLSPVPHHAHPFVVKSPWQPPISLSPVDGYHSQRARLKLSST